VRATVFGGAVTLLIASGAAWRWRDLTSWELRTELARPREAISSD
jgi:hypothetical protein